MILTIEHHTRYQYQGEVRRSTQYLRLTPPSTPHQRVLNWELQLPETATCTVDGYGNILHVLTLAQPHEEIEILARGKVEILNDEAAEAETLSPLIFLRHTPLTRADQAIRDFALTFTSQPTTARQLEAMMRALLLRMPYSPGATSSQHTAAEAFALGKGVCQDHTHVYLACCRTLGLPARYVSGYLYTQDSQHVATHAWAEVWYDNGWHTVDVTNQCTTPHQHLRLAVGMDYLDACPVRGVRTGGGDEAMQAHAAVSLTTEQQQQQQQQ